MVAMFFATFSVFSKRNINSRTSEEGMTQEISAENTTTSEAGFKCGAVSELAWVCHGKAKSKLGAFGLTMRKEKAACSQQCELGTGSVLGMQYCKCPVAGENCASVDSVNPWPGAKTMYYQPPGV